MYTAIPFTQIIAYKYQKGKMKKKSPNYKTYFED